nr:hypothetical protein SHINE37_70119 [Rhizobiaceae bacterium]
MMLGQARNYPGPQILDGDRRNWPRGLAKASVSPLNIPAGPGKKNGPPEKPWPMECGDQNLQRGTGDAAVLGGENRDVHQLQA